MRILIQRVTEAQCDISGKTFSQIGGGVVVLVGIGRDDADEDIEYLARKLVALRIFDDSDGIMNLSLAQTGGEVMIVSQFTLQASTRRGNRPLVDQGCSRGDIASSVREIRTTCRGAPGQENGYGSIRRRHADNAYQRRAGYDMDRLARQRLNEISYIHETY